MKLRWPWESRERHPELVRNEHYFAKFDLSRPVDEYDFVAFDSELTGMNPHKDEIVSLAGVRIRDQKIVLDDCFFSRVRTTKHIPTESTFIHRITPEQTKRAPEPEIVIPAFVEFCGDSVLVGHFAELDLSFLDRATRKIMGGTMRNPCVDSLELAKTLRHNERKHSGESQRRNWSYNLTRLSAAYGLPRFHEHDALADALQTAYLFVFLVEKLKNEGMKTLDALHGAGGVSGRIH